MLLATGGRIILFGLQRGPKMNSILKAILAAVCLFSTTATSAPAIGRITRLDSGTGLAVINLGAEQTIGVGEIIALTSADGTVYGFPVISVEPKSSVIDTRNVSGIVKVGDLVTRNKDRHMVDALLGRPHSSTVIITKLKPNQAAHAER